MHVTHVGLGLLTGFIYSAYMAMMIADVVAAAAAAVFIRHADVGKVNEPTKDLKDSLRFIICEINQTHREYTLCMWANVKCQLPRRPS